MSKILTPDFNRAAHYLISLPPSFMLDRVFSNKIMEKFKTDAITAFPYMGTEDLSDEMVHATFVDQIAGRLKSFLKDNDEDDRITLILDDTATAIPMLKFVSSPKTIQKLKDRLEDMFGDLTLSDDFMKHGSSWKNLPIDRIDPIMETIISSLNPC